MLESWEVIERAIKLVEEYTNAVEEPRIGQNDERGGELLNLGYTK